MTMGPEPIRRILLMSVRLGISARHASLRQHQRVRQSSYQISPEHIELLKGPIELRDKLRMECMHIGHRLQLIGRVPEAGAILLLNPCRSRQCQPVRIWVSRESPPCDPASLSVPRTLWLKLEYGSSGTPGDSQ